MFSVSWKLPGRLFDGFQLWHHPAFVYGFRPCCFLMVSVVAGDIVCLWFPSLVCLWFPPSQVKPKSENVSSETSFVPAT